MIPLSLPAETEVQRPYVTRLRSYADEAREETDAILLYEEDGNLGFSGRQGLLAIEGVQARDVDGDVVMVLPDLGRAERLLRRGSLHNTLLLTERCDQLCVMCSQPPKKTHIDRFALFEEACLLAEPDTVIGLTGGEPTLFKDQLLGMIERVIEARPDLQFHVLSNAQHFDEADIERLRAPAFRAVSWGIPLYASKAALHDDIVGKAGAFERLHQSLHCLLLAGARIELRTVLVSSNVEALPALGRYVSSKLRFIESWSIMQLEKIGFAKNRWSNLFVDHVDNFDPISSALDQALLRGVNVHLLNFPRCTVPAHYRHLAPASISDWKRKYQPACSSCSEQSQCCGFFEWHPDEHANARVTPL